MKINLFQVKTLFTLCLKLSQSKDKLSNLNSTVYSCYSCVRLRRDLFFHRLSCIQKFASDSHSITLSCLSQYFWLDYENNLFQVKTLFTLCLKLSQSKDILSHFNSSVYSCFNCARLRRGLIFLLLSCIHKFA